MLNIWFVIVVVVARTFILLFRHIICLTTICLNCKGQDIYFSPLSNLANKETISPFSLGWCLNEIDTLYDFLQQENSKGFILLNDGKIVLEKYFGTFILLINSFSTFAKVFSCDFGISFTGQISK